MRMLYIICSVITSVASITLAIIFIKLRKNLAGNAWILVFSGFMLALINNLIITYLVVGRPRGTIAIVLIAAFFIIKATKNIFWLIGFLMQYKSFGVLENLDDYIKQLEGMQKTHEPLSRDLTNDLDSNK